MMQANDKQTTDVPMMVDLMPSSSELDLNTRPQKKWFPIGSAARRAGKGLERKVGKPCSAIVQGLLSSSSSHDDWPFVARLALHPRFGIPLANRGGMDSPFLAPRGCRFRLADAAMSRYARGDNVSFAEVHDLLAPRLHRYLARRTGDAAAQDLLQQTLLRIHAARGQFRPGSAVLPWAFAIARSVLVDSVRRSKHRLQLASESIEEPSADSGLDERLDGLLWIEKLKATLTELPQAQRRAFELVDVEGRSLREVAELLGTTTTAVKIRAHRARSALRQAIAQSIEG